MITLVAALVLALLGFLLKHVGNRQSKPEVVTAGQWIMWVSLIVLLLWVILFIVI